MILKIYKVLQAVDHNNVRTEADDTLNLSDDEAAPLLAVNAIEDTGTTVQSLIPATAPTDQGDLLTAIRAAISLIDVDNPDLWLKDGKPSTDAIAAVTGWPVSSRTRDAAMAVIAA